MSSMAARPHSQKFLHMLTNTTWETEKNGCKYYCCPSINPSKIIHPFHRWIHQSMFQPSICSSLHANVTSIKNLSFCPSIHRWFIHIYPSINPFIHSNSSIHSIYIHQSIIHIFNNASIHIHLFVHPSIVIFIHPYPSNRSSIQSSTSSTYITHLGEHWLHVGDLHLSPHSLWSVSQAPHLLLGHIVLVINVEKQSIVYFPKAMQQVVEPQAVFVVAW